MLRLGTQRVRFVCGMVSTGRTSSAQTSRSLFVGRGAMAPGGGVRMATAQCQRFFSQTKSGDDGAADKKSAAAEEAAAAAATTEVTEEEEERKKGQSLVAMDDDYDDYDYEPPRTAADKFNNFFVLALQLAFFGAIVAGAGLAVKELFPGRLKPQSLYSEAYDSLRLNDDVTRICGEDMRAFGRDTGSESRRSQVDQREFTEADGSKRVRIRFNIKGSKGHVKVWAEASDKMGANEWVYLIVQNMKTGTVMTIEDERERLAREMLLNKTQDMKGTGSALTDSLSQLINGGGGKK